MLEGMTRSVTPSCPGLGRLVRGVFRAVSGTRNIKLTTPRVNLPVHMMAVGLSILSSSLPRCGSFHGTCVGTRVLRISNRRISVSRNYLDLPKVRRSIGHNGGVHIRCLSRGLRPRSRVVRNCLTHIVRRRFSRLRKGVFVSRLSPLHGRVVGKGLGTVLGNGTRYACGIGAMGGWIWPCGVMWGTRGVWGIFHWSQRMGRGHCFYFICGRLWGGVVEGVLATVLLLPALLCTRVGARQIVAVTQGTLCFRSCILSVRCFGRMVGTGPCLCRPCFFHKLTGVGLSSCRKTRDSYSTTVREGPFIMNTCRVEKLTHVHRGGFSRTVRSCGATVGCSPRGIIL